MIDLLHFENSYVDHPLLRLEGTVLSSLSNVVSVHNITTGSLMNWPINNDNNFICFTELCVGSNTIRLQHAFYVKTVTVFFQPRDTAYLLQPLYVVCDGDAGMFQAPDGIDCTIQSACARISLAIALLQTFTYTSLQEIMGAGAKTFQTPLDNKTRLPLCRVFHSKLSKIDVYNMTECEVWKNLAKEIMSESDVPQSERVTTKYIAFLSCTSYSGSDWTASWRHRDIIAATKGYVAIGGGGLAVLGTGTLHTWADSLENLVTHFTDRTIIDQSQFLDDSAYRHTYWANYATGLGATLHELGHTLDLAHTEHGIMSRGDNIHKFFVLDGSFPVKQPDKSEVERYKRLAAELEKQRQMNSQELVTSYTVFKESWCPTVKVTDNSSASNTDSLYDLGNSSMSADIQTDYIPSSCTVGSTNLHISSSASSLAIGGLVEADKNDSITNTTTDISTWAPESAVMLYYSRWLLSIEEYEKVYQKPSGNSSEVTALSGIRSLQIYSSCIDRIVTADHFTSDSPPISLSPEKLAKQNSRIKNLKHKSGCQLTCLEAHIRDSVGHFLKIKLRLS